MEKLKISAFDLAQRFVGLAELPGVASNPQVLAMLQLDQEWPAGDEVPWCSAFVNYITWLLRLPRSKSLLARSWLAVGTGIPLSSAEVGFDVVVLSRSTVAPGPDNLSAPGHVGFFAGSIGGTQPLLILGGNQGNSVSVAQFALNRVLGIRRLV